MYTPTVGEEIYIQALTPYNKLSLKEIYFVTSVTLINEYEGSDIDVFEDVYNVVGLTRDDMANDVKNKVPIISLGDELGSTSSIPLPLNRIEILNQNGIPYRKQGIGINLGLLPADLDLESLMEDLAILVEDRLGIEPKLKMALLSNKRIVPNNVHEDSIRERKLHQSSTTSYRIESLSLKNKVGDLVATMAKLKTCLINK